VLPGDGIGQEVIPAAVAVLQAVAPDIVYESVAAGWDCFVETGSSVPEESLAAIRRCGAGLFGAVSSPLRKVAGYRSAILMLRQELELYANIRPVQSWPGVSPRPDVDLVVVRENSEGLYIGDEESDGETAVARRRITRTASRRIGAVAARLAVARRGQLTIVHKANVLPLSDGLFRDAVRDAVAEEAAGLQVEELLVDVAALKLLSEPQSFDVLVTTNLFGDILSDAAAHWCGGLGMAPSLNLGQGIALAEPVHGAAADIAGRGVANPLAAILSGALLLRHHWGRIAAAKQVETAVGRTTAQLGQLAGTTAIQEAVLGHLAA
jgi:homoisocitrate dehydrogenase